MFYGYWIVLACCALCFAPVAMSFNTAGLFYTPVSEDLGVSTGEFGRLMTFQYAALAIAMPFAGRIFNRFDSRLVLSVCVIAVAGGLFGMSLATQVWHFYLAAVFIGAVNSVLMYLVVPTMIDRWFHINVGLLVGIAFAFTGIGGTLLNIAAGYVIDNFGWRAGYMFEALLIAILCLPLTMFVVRSYPKDIGLEPLGKGEEDAANAGTAELAEGAELAENVQQAADATRPTKTLKGVSLSRAVRSPAFYVMMLHAGIMEAGLTLNYYIPSYMNSLGMTALVASTVSASTMIGQTIAKVLLGKINDHNVKWGVRISVASGIVGISIIALLSHVSPIFIYVGAFIFGFYFAGLTVTTSLMTRDVFPGRDYSRIFSFVGMGAAIAAAFSSSIWGMIVDATGSYETMFMTGVAMMFSVFLIGFLYFKLGERVVPDLEE